MSQVRLAQIFLYKNVSPSGLKDGNLISFKYQSPQGVTDKTPLVYVLEKKFDKFYGLNLHYDGNALQEIIDNIELNVNSYLESKYYSQYPDKLKEHNEEGVEFNKTFIEQKDYFKYKNGFNKNNLEIFNLASSNNESNFRCYLYKRMNNVSKLVWKL